MSHVPLETSIVSRVELAECQIDTATGEFIYGTVPVAQEAVINGVRYYVYPASGGQVTLERTHYASMAAGGDRNAVVIGEKTYNGKIVPAGSYGYDYSILSTGAVKLTDGFNTYISDADNKVTIDGRVYNVSVAADLTVSLEEVMPEAPAVTSVVANADGTYSFTAG
ncbi:hypothetical protein LDC_1253, partial [sediment metagenome]